MPHHFPKDTTEASIFCAREMKFTLWRISDGHRHFCLSCAAIRLAKDLTEAEAKATKAAELAALPQQKSMFDEEPER